MQITKQIVEECIETAARWSYLDKEAGIALDEAVSILNGNYQGDYRYAMSAACRSLRHSVGDSSEDYLKYADMLYKADL